MATHQFETKSGYTLNLRRIPMQVVELAVEKVDGELRAEHVPLDPPGFFLQFDLPDGQPGDKQWYAHSPATLVVKDDPQATAENQARWAAYQAALERRDQARSTRRLTIWYQYGVQVEGGVPGVPEPSDAEDKIVAFRKGEDDGAWMDDPNYWQTVSRMLGASLPTDPLELKARWLTERCLNTEEVAALTAELFGLQMEGQLPPDELESFRAGLRATATGAIRTKTAQVVAAVKRALDTRTSGGASGGGEVREATA